MKRADSSPRRVRRRPYSVVLFDEIEKAHPDVMNLLLQILEEGMITRLARPQDRLPQHHHHHHSHNVGADVIKRQVTLGFGAMGGGDENYDNMRGQDPRARQGGLQARVPQVSTRRSSSTSSTARTSSRSSISRSTPWVKRLAAKNIHLKLDKKAKEFLIEQGYDPNYGARPMRRAVERHIEDPLAEHLLRGDVKAGQTVKITHKKDEKYLTFRPESADSPEDDAVESGEFDGWRGRGCRPCSQKHLASPEGTSGFFVFEVNSAIERQEVRHRSGGTRLSRRSHKHSTVREQFAVFPDVAQSPKPKSGPRRSR